MASTAEKKALWDMIRRDHPAFGLNLQAQKGQEDAFVSIEDYPEETVVWLRAAIAAHNPVLDEHIRDVLIPEQAKMKQFFNAKLTIRVQDLVDALLAFETGTEKTKQVVSAA